MGMKKKEINYQLLIRRICLIVLDIICIIAASILALLTRFEFDFSQIPKEFLKVIYKYGPFTIVITLIIFSLFRIYSSLWEYAGIEEVFSLIAACLAAAVAKIVIILFTWSVMPRSWYVLDTIYLMILIGATRVSYRLIRLRRQNRTFPWSPCDQGLGGHRQMKFFRKHKKRKIAGIIILLIVLLIGGIYGSIWWKFYGDSVGVVSADKVDPNAKKVKIAKEKRKDKDVYNVLLVGTDSRDPDADRGRSDSMMMVSFNKKEGKSTAISFLRDSLVDIDGHGKSRLGHTYAYGGVGLTINTINKTYDLDIQNYITISFDDLVNVIDEIGGVTVFISEEEAAYYRENGMPDIQAGDVTLTGSQALAHARNRTLGNDFERTRRQRSVMYGIYRKIMEKKDPSALLPLINYAVNHVRTNMSVSEMYSMAKDVLSVDDLKMQQTCIPQDGTYTDITYEGMQVLKVDFDANKKKIEQLLY